MLATIDKCGTGLNADLTAEELGDGVWTAASNMRFSNGYAERFKGTVQVFDAPVVTPYYLAPYATNTTRYWIHAGLASTYADDGTTRTNITGTPNTGAIDDRITGGTINGVYIQNNGVDIPQYWAGTGTLASIPGWDATWRAKAMRPWRNFIFALNVTKGSTQYPHMLKSCTTLEPGAITAAGDWDETNPALDALELPLPETPDVIVDGLPLGDAFIVYKERSMYAITYIGYPQILRAQRLPGETGMLARGCGVNTPLGHIVLTAGDIVLNTGQGVTSVANGIVRDYLFRNISSDYYMRAFVTANPQRNEVWVCYPHGPVTTCNKALVWNWVDKSWGVRELSNVTFGAFGQINYTAAEGTYDSIDAIGTTYDQMAGNYDDNNYSPAEARLLMTHTTPYVSLQDSGSTDFGAVIRSSLERTGITFGDPFSVKMLRAVWPKIDGDTGATVVVQVGAAMYADQQPTWSTPQTFTIGETEKIDCRVSGKYIAIRLDGSDYFPWRVKSFGVDYAMGGTR